MEAAEEKTPLLDNADNAKIQPEKKAPIFNVKNVSLENLQTWSVTLSVVIVLLLLVSFFSQSFVRLYPLMGLTLLSSLVAGDIFMYALYWRKNRSCSPLDTLCFNAVLGLSSIFMSLLAESALFWMGGAAAHRVVRLEVDVGDFDLGAAVEYLPHPYSTCFFMLFFSFVAIAAVEEAVKLAVLLLCIRRQPAAKEASSTWTPIAVVVTAAAVAFGFSSVNYLLLVPIFRGGRLWMLGARAQVARAVFETVVQMSTAVIIGAEVASQDILNKNVAATKTARWLRILQLPVALHGTYELLLAIIYVTAFDVNTGGVNVLIWLATAAFSVIVVKVASARLNDVCHTELIPSSDASSVSV